jgi:hypothetical protein
MSGPGTLLRLLARRHMLWTLFPLFWAVAVPLMVVGGADASSTQLWHVMVLVPAVLGAAVAFARLELQHTTLSWPLPGVRNGLVAGTLAVAVPLAAGCALLAAWTAPAGAGTVYFAAAFGVSLFCFAFASGIPDTGIQPSLRWTGLGVLAVAAVRPGLLSALVAAAPWLVTAAAACGAAIMLAVPFSRQAARRRHFRWSAAAPDIRTDLYWRARPSQGARWAGSLSTDNLIPWLRAAAYEGAAGRRVPLAAQYLLMAFIAVLAGHLVGHAGQTMIVSGILLVQGRLRLGSGLSYPLSRTQRADLATAGALVEAAVFVALLSLMLMVVRVAAVSVPAWFADDGGSAAFGWLPALAMTFAWAPVAQWGPVIWPGPPGSGVDVRRVFLLLAYAVPAVISARAIGGLDSAAIAGLAAVLAAAGYTVFWLAARRHLARADLLHLTA